MFATILNAKALLYLQAIVLSSDGHNLVTGGDKGVVEVWQACDFKQLYVYPGCDAGIRAMDLSHDQRSEQTVDIVYNGFPTASSVCKVELTQTPVFTLIVLNLLNVQPETLTNGRHHGGARRMTDASGLKCV